MSNFLQAARHTDPSSPLPHQDAAWQWAWEQFSADKRAEFLEMFRAAVPVKEPLLPVTPKPPAGSVQLSVPYECQNDNVSGTGWRECFSSAAAMVAKFYGKISSDDAYNKIRARFGDTTNGNAHVKALQSLGLKTRFGTNGNAAFLEKEIRAGRPVLVGWLHKGSVSSPSGGGHWSVVTGFTPLHFIHNDPNGEADMVHGGYMNNSKGKGIAYSRKNWLKRWEVDGANTGWYVAVER
jgi:hypothetical protein